jgi:hypothetical protein
MQHHDFGSMLRTLAGQVSAGEVDNDTFIREFIAHPSKSLGPAMIEQELVMLDREARAVAIELLARAGWTAVHASARQAFAQSRTVGEKFHSATALYILDRKEGLSALIALALEPKSQKESVPDAWIIEDLFIEDGFNTEYPEDYSAVLQAVEQRNAKA